MSRVDDLLGARGARRSTPSDRLGADRGGAPAPALAAVEVGRLPGEGACAIVRAGDVIVVAQDHHLTAFAGGTPVWQVAVDDFVAAAAAVAVAGWLVTAEGRSVAWRDPATGALLARTRLDGPVGALTVGPGTSVIAAVRTPAGRQARAWDRPSDGPGRLLARLDDPGPRPQAVGAVVVVATDGAVHGHGLDSVHRWRAGRTPAVRSPDSPEVAGPIGLGRVAGDRVGAVTVVDAGTVVVGLDWPDGRGHLVVEAATGAGRWLETGEAILDVGLALAPVLLAGGPGLVGVGVDRAVVAIDRRGGVAWRRMAVSAPQALVAIAGGVLAIHSPRRSHWEAYRNVYQQPQCFLAALDGATGGPRGIWIAPGPIAPGVLAEPGRVYVVAEGALHAVVTP